jgi:hypothetical protein
MLWHVSLVTTDFSENFIASFIRVTISISSQHASVGS